MPEEGGVQEENVYVVISKICTTNPTPNNNTAANPAPATKNDGPPTN